MKLFKSKQEKEFEKKQQVKQALRELDKRIVTLRKKEEIYIGIAKKAIEENLPDQVELAKKALKMTISERKHTQKMLLNAQIISQMRDMGQMTNEFLNAMHIISKDIAQTTVTDMSSVTDELRMAMDKVSTQTEELTDMLEDAESDITDYTQNADVADAEIEKRIYGSGSEEDAAIEAEFAELAKIAKQD